MTRVAWLQEPIQIDASTPKHPDTLMLIDRGDWLRLQRMGIGKIFPTHAAGSSTLYICGALKRKVVLLHRLLLPHSILVDHINRNTLDNRRINIRTCSKAQNSMNRGTPKNNTSGHRGVRKKKGNLQKPWEAFIKLEQIHYYIGMYKTKQEAIGMRKAAEILYFKEFAPC